MAKRSSVKAQTLPEGIQTLKILLYSISQESIDDYSKTLEHMGVDFEVAVNQADAKRMLNTKQFGILLADVTEFENSGRNLIRWAKNHIQPYLPNFRTHGFTRTDLPNIFKRIYSRGVDQRFLFDHTDIDSMPELIYSMLIVHSGMPWAVDVINGQKELRKKYSGNYTMSNPVLLNGPKGMCKECLTQIVHAMLNKDETEFIVLDCNPRQRYDYAYKQNKDTIRNRDFIRENLQMAFGLGHKGTVYIRSFTHLPLMVQEVLADVLEKGLCLNPETQRLHKFEGRIVFANNKSLPELVKSNKVSARLYGMIMGNVMDIKPLAQYGKECILEMANAIIAHLCVKGRGEILTFSKKALKLITNYPWPGNIDEMYDVFRQALRTAKNRVIDEKDLFMIAPPEETEEEDIEIYEPTKDNIMMLLKKHIGNKSMVAKHIDKSRVHLYKLMDDFEIPRDYK